MTGVQTCALPISGNFVTVDEQREFERLLQTPKHATSVEYLGFVSDEKKRQALFDADLFCFPTQYIGENQPVNLIEAMAFGLPTVTTRWRSLPEMFPPDYPGLVSSQSPQEITDALLALMELRTAELLRENFLNQFNIERHLVSLAEAIRGAEA